MVISGRHFEVTFGGPTAQQSGRERVRRNHHEAKVIVKDIFEVVLKVILRPFER